MVDGLGQPRVAKSRQTVTVSTPPPLSILEEKRNTGAEYATFSYRVRICSRDALLVLLPEGLRGCRRPTGLLSSRVRDRTFYGITVSGFNSLREDSNRAF